MQRATNDDDDDEGRTVRRREPNKHLHITPLPTHTPMRLQAAPYLLAVAATAGSRHLTSAFSTLLSRASVDTSRGFDVARPTSVLPRSGVRRFMSDETAEGSIAADDSFVVEAFEMDTEDKESVVESPSDVEEETLSDPPFFVANDASSSSRQSNSLDKNLLYLQSLGAITSRGEFASKAQKQSAMNVIQSVEEMNPTPEPTASPSIRGRWELVYSTTQLFRSSPFFLAGRATCTTPDQAKQYDWFCQMHRQALSVSTIGPVRQIVGETTLTHEFAVKAGAVPFLSDLTPFSYSGGLPVSAEGAIVSTADLTVVDSGTAWELLMDTVEIKGSNIPVVRQLIDAGIKLRSRELGRALESIPSLGYTNPRPVFRTTYLDGQFRISRDQDDNAFVYVKTSGDESPTDYSSVDSDLGIGRLLEGFNDAITMFYL